MPSYEVDPEEVFEATYEAGETGLAGTLAVAIHDSQSLVVYGPTILQIVELIVGGQATGSYRANLTAPADEGQYTINWSNDGSFDPDAGGGLDELLVAISSGGDLPPLGPGVEDSVLCNAWTTAEDAVECCSAEIGSDTTFLEIAIVSASEFLYEASGRRYPGECSRTVRPCDKQSTCGCGYQVLSRGHLVGWSGSCWGSGCGCTPISKVLLAGRVREITSVKIDGVVIDPDTYFVRDRRELIRKSPDRWPSCQSEDLDDTEEGTFSVTYTYGKAPPVSGQLAASALACEIVKSCTPGEECALPNGAIRITRQGITMERTFFVRNSDGVWVTGIGAVDYFLNGVNPDGLRRNGVGWSPGRRFARPNPV